MQIEDFIYDAAVLKMGVCLERFLKLHLKTRSNNLKSMINKFCTGRDDETSDWMHKIRKARNAAAHWDEERNKVAHSSIKKTDAVFDDLGSFQNIRRVGLELDKQLIKTTGYDTGMSEIMISSSLPYDMGNAGDLLKHGALATFVDWFLWCGEKQIHYADPFGGRPWGYILKKKTRRRMEEFSSLSVIQDAQPHWRNGNGHQPHWRRNRYYGSSHVVRNIAKARKKIAHVFASDKDKLARSDLEASGIKLIDKQYQEYKPKRGFDILNERYDGAFDLILLDPFADFLLNEFGGYRRERSTGHFDSIFQAVERNPKLCVVLFVLHDAEGDRIATDYAEKRKNIRDFSFSMRCPRIRGTEVDGEDGYDMEILLTSMRFAERDHPVGEMKDRLDQLARTLEEVLLLKPGEIEFRHPD